MPFQIFNAITLNDLYMNIKDINVVNKQGSTPLHIFVINKKIDIVKECMKYCNIGDIDINKQNYMGQTPLHLVNDNIIAKLLLDNFANPFIPDNKGIMAINNPCVKNFIISKIYKNNIIK